MIKTAVLVDGGYALHIYRNLNKGQLPSALQLMALAASCVNTQIESLFRVFYYDCRPYGRKLKFPGATSETDFSTSPDFAARNKLYSAISKSENAAFRSGELKFRGWTVDKKLVRQLSTSTQSIQQTFAQSDLKPSFQQKGVDIKIGIDIASLSIKKIVDRIALLTNDTDFIPAMKFARREGTQIVLCSLANQHSAPELADHADFMRVVNF